ncbi:ABC transporter permease [Tianweitania sediminis]|uniref:ABC transporter permease n=1 Tax=Tianweitania sediminis TaxID=1502156 RepID=A0A8J7QYD6_9HYPH|nr:ABC transporter permease [Tianweitania sediminis]MBP0437053.1 ABC transporter permease [Tianweitania sediminis]HEV7415560.1 ABC transporter permease [Tianweitania sediminis]
MLAYIIKRTLAVIPVMAIVALIVFLILRLTPGDPAAIIAGDSATPEQIASMREAMGLNEPIYLQFLHWIGQLLQGDLGTSLLSGTSVNALIASRIWPTLYIALLTIVMSVLIAVPLGTIAAWRHGRLSDHIVMIISVAGFSVPAFVVGYIFIKIFAADLRWLPVQGYKDPALGFGEFLRHAILPALTLTTAYVALTARMTRASLLNVLGEDYIRTAHAKGVSEPRVLLQHGLRNAAVPILTVVGTGFAMLLSGVVVVESVFNIPGIGRLTIDAVMARDYPVIQGMILLTSGIYVLVNLAIDLAYTLFDPRIRY